jgi:hypothetical protein
LYKISPGRSEGPQFTRKPPAQKREWTLSQQQSQLLSNETTGIDQARGQSTSAATLRQFVRSLTLDNASERIAAIAYYANKVEGRQTFSPKEIDGWFTMCGFQKPAQMGVAIFDCKRKYGYLENVGRGMWKISTQGENLILGKLENNSAA